MRVFLCFVDGVGLGGDDPGTNPLAAARMPALRSLLGGRPLTASAVPKEGPDAWIVPVDARLGVAGLPQSATGQTAIFTGQNGAQVIGRHLNAYPTPRLKELLNQYSIFRQVRGRGGQTTFLNAFPPRFFDWVAAGQPMAKDRRLRPSASTVAGLAAGVEVFRTLDQLRQGDAVGFDIDHHMMRERGYDLEPVDPAEAGRRAARIAGQHRFTLYEHFLTDTAGHTRDPQVAIPALERLDRFLSGLLEAQPPDLLLIIISDHGNIEDLSVKTHTLNPVPAILRGPGAADAAMRIRTLTDLTPVILSLLEQTPI